MEKHQVTYHKNKKGRHKKDGIPRPFIIVPLAFSYFYGKKQAPFFTSDTHNIRKASLKNSSEIFCGFSIVPPARRRLSAKNGGALASSHQTPKGKKQKNIRKNFCRSAARLAGTPAAGGTNIRRLFYGISQKGSGQSFCPLFYRIGV